VKQAPSTSKINPSLLQLRPDDNIIIDRHKHCSHFLPEVINFTATMYCLSLISVVVLGLILLLGTEAFVNGNNNSRQRRGARGQTSTTTRTSPAAPATVLHMAPKKAKKKAAAVPSAETLRKKDVVAAVSEQCDMTKTDAEAAVSAVFATISDVRAAITWSFV
jgi:hypothetical protein